LKRARGTPPTLTEVLDVDSPSAAPSPLPPTTEALPLEATVPRLRTSSRLPTLLEAQIEARVRAAVAALMPAWQEALVQAVTAAVAEEVRAQAPPPSG